MALRAPFRKCTRCGAKLPPSDGHSHCLLCLGEGHKVDSCHNCQAFSRQTRKNRADRLKAELWTKALQAVQNPKQSMAAVAPNREQTNAPVPRPHTPPQSSSAAREAPPTPGRATTNILAKKLAKRARATKAPEAQKKKKKKTSHHRQPVQQEQLSLPTTIIPSTSRVDTVQSPSASRAGNASRPSTATADVRRPSSASRIPIRPRPPVLREEARRPPSTSRLTTTPCPSVSKPSSPSRANNRNLPTADKALSPPISRDEAVPSVSISEGEIRDSPQRTASIPRLSQERQCHLQESPESIHSTAPRHRSYQRIYDIRHRS